MGERLFDLPHLASGFSSGALEPGQGARRGRRGHAGERSRNRRGRRHALRQGPDPARPLAQEAHLPTAMPPTRRTGRSASTTRSAPSPPSCRPPPTSRPRTASTRRRARGTARRRWISAWPTPSWSSFASPVVVRRRRRPRMVARGPRAPGGPADEESTLCGELERGGYISGDAIRRLACDSTLIIAADDDAGHTMYEGPPAAPGHADPAPGDLAA